MKAKYFLLLILCAMLCIAPAMADTLNGTAFTGNRTLYVNGSSSGALTNYPVMLILFNTTGINTTGALYINNTVNANWSDVRFSQDGTTELPYWMETATNNSTSATFWINMSSIAAATNQTPLYVLWGNASATSNSNGNTTFPFFDDFNGALDTTAKWTEILTGGNSISNGVLTISGNNAYRGITSKNTYLVNNRTRSLIQIYSTEGSGNTMGYLTGSNFMRFIYDTGKYRFYSYNGTLASVNSTATNTTNVIDIIRNGTYSGKLYVNNTFGVEQTASASVPIDAENIVLRGYNTGTQITCNWVFNTKYAYSEPTINPGQELVVANFTTNRTAGTSPFSVQFNDTSLNNPTVWEWNFGDGSANTTTQNPVHSYSTGGLFNVSLNATNSAGSNTVTKVKYIKTLAVNFTGTPTTGGNPLTVAFNDTSTPYGNATNWLWSFGDGQQSTMQNVTHVYTTAGSYNVTLNVTADFTTGTKTQTNYITVSAVAPTANFYAVPAWGSSPLNVSFYDISTGSPTSWAWQWGDGEANGTTQNPYHEYASNGQYTVNMTATNTIGATTKQRVGYILVGTTGGGGGGALNSIFRYNITSGIYPLSVKFTDLSTGGPETWNWSWGDATANGTTQNPTHTYSAAGSYTVTLTVTNATQTPNSSTSQEANFIVVANTGSPQANFFADNTWGINFVNTTFYDVSGGGNATSWNWSWGDATANGTTQNPVHNYTTVGVYNVTMTATNPEGSTVKTRNSYIQVSDGKPETSFYAMPTNGSYPLNVSFTDTSGNTPTSWAWQWGDGEANGTTQNPSHSYAGAGTYTVTMTASNSYGSTTKQISAYIGVTAPSVPIASFYAHPTNGTAPLNVSFVDTSANTPTSWAWAWGDGEANGTVKNPTHNYTTAGTYNVTLTATNAFGSNTTVLYNYIGVANLSAPVASFYGAPTNGTAPLNVSFTDTSSNAPTSWNWSWGDATANGTTQNPYHNYTTAGTYNVTLTAINAYGSNTTVLYNYIGVTNLSAPVASFYGTPTVGTVPFNATFTDTSSNTPTSWAWDFGDGTSNSTLQNPVHQYTAAGTYNVTLTSTNAYGSNTTRILDMIQGNDPSGSPPTAAFSASATSINATLPITFTDESSGSPIAWLWDFGDSGSSALQNPTHAYSTAGTFTVKLRATNIYGTDWENKTNYITVSAATPTPTITPTPTPTPIPTATQVHSGGSAPPYQAPDVPFPSNNNTGVHLLNVSVDTGNQTVTFLGKVDNVTNDTTAWFTLGATTEANSYYTVALVPDPVSGNVTGQMGLSSPMAAGTKYYVKMASTKGLALESLNFSTPAAVALPTSTYGAYWNKVQASNKTPLSIMNAIPLPLVDLFGGSAAGAGNEFGWRIVFTLIIGLLVMVIAIRQDNLILVFMLIGLTGPVWLSLIVPEFVWIPATICYLVAATTLYRLYRNRRS